MARVLTKEERIQHMLQENARRPCTSMERTYDYCKAFVEGEMAIGAKIEGINEMTRAEALAKLRMTTHKDYNPADFLNMVEAIGLIKFKEPEPVNVNRERFRLAMRKLGYCEGSKGYHDAVEAYDSIYT